MAEQFEHEVKQRDAALPHTVDKIDGTVSDVHFKCLGESSTQEHTVEKFLQTLRKHYPNVPFSKLTMYSDSSCGLSIGLTRDLEDKLLTGK